ncbi:MAG: HAMP domain-containing sensor histidine kinase [Verrucomicrobiota bacterium]
MSFRVKLLLAMTLVAVAITGLGLLVVARKVAAETEHDLEQNFRAELDALHTIRQVRQAALAERCRALVRRPRILAALEDEALDLLYSSAKDELRDLLQDEAIGPTWLRAKFYRFLDRDGRILRAEMSDTSGALTEAEVSQLCLRGLPDTQQNGFLWRGASGDLVELFAVPIISSETGDIISALIIGLASSNVRTGRETMVSGVLVNGSLHFPTLSPLDRAAIAAAVSTEAAGGKRSGKLAMFANGKQSRVFFNLLNPASSFQPVYEICLYPLTALLARQKTLRWQAAGICSLLLVSGVIGSQFIAKRLSKPVEKLELDSAENLAKRQKAEAALEITSQELQRAARFSADASHQLKTPVTVLRAGLDELLVTEELSAAAREEIASLLHQTFRLNNIIDDLLLLSRMDAGRLQLNLEAVSLTNMLEAWMDDFSTLACSDISLLTDLNSNHRILGEKRYTSIIVENLLDNARKYNRPAGHIKVSTSSSGGRVVLRIGNTGRTIPPETQTHVFERFHRGTAGENVPGYGLGLNLARELARLHSGELRLVISQNDWTEFEVTFCLAPPTSHGGALAVV